MASWNSLKPNPGSLLFPPDGYKWFIRKNLPGTQTLFAPNWKQVCIAELRGWLRDIDPGANPIDPDWLYVLEVAFSPQLDQLVVVTSSREGNVMSATWAPSMSAWSAWSLIN